MDPFSITVGAIGVTDIASRSILELRNLIDNLSEAQDMVADVNSSLANIQRPLDALEKLSISDEATSIALKEDLEKAGVAEAVNSCGKACKTFNENLTKWTKHSSNTKLSLRDRFSVGVWNKEKIRTFRTQLQYCEATVHFAVSSAQLMVQQRSERAFEANRESVTSQFQSLETKIQEHLDAVKIQKEEAEKRMQELKKEPEDEEDGGAGRELAMQEVTKQERLLEADQLSCGVVFLQVQSKMSGQDISKIVTSENSKAFVGMPKSVVGKINQRISDVRTEGGSIAHVGVFQDDIHF